VVFLRVVFLRVAFFLVAFFLVAFFLVAFFLVARFLAIVYDLLCTLSCLSEQTAQNRHGGTPAGRIFTFIGPEVEVP
jgi:hypothetical protein